ncbi:3'(2'),5'-bisphosphate nucleotidase CysQ [Celerinatantimonas sp. YJH-8]|uniref:3'(2'),5'-bisphosphate nucleotidase CysQ n=1 Tax=Celerinatantimonas sp. YJH-8 TaxID=3228714 RepID=UPI0038BEBAE7
MQQLDLLQPQVEKIARQAGQAILELYQSGCYQSEIKADDTPVTSADYAAHQIIMQQLQQLTPEYPVLSEEQADIHLQERQQWQRYWLVDPMDGTQEFVSGTGDFSTMIALIDQGEPVLGLVYAPVSDVCYFAIKGQGAYKRQGMASAQPISCTHYQRAPDLISIAVSRVQKEQKLRRILNPDFNYSLIPLGSASLKSCLVAEGQADCYIRLGPTGEWDIGAPQVILREAGGVLLDLNLQPMSFNRHESLLNPDFIGIGDQSLPWADIIAKIPQNDRIRSRF